MIDVILQSIIIITSGLVFVVYIGYPLFIQFLKPAKPLVREEFSESNVVYHIVPVYNEEEVIKQKLENCLIIHSKLKIVHVFIVDLSSDDTTKIISEYESRHQGKIKLIDKGYRKGKNDSINLAISNLDVNENDVLFFSDANTMFHQDSFMHLFNELENGYALVGGSMKYVEENSDTAKSEGLYWKYEEWIRRNEAKIGRCIVVNGGNFAMLAKYYQELPDYVPNDFEAPLRLCGEGNYVGFNSLSIGYEPSVLHQNEEMKRKGRMANRQTNCIRYLWKTIDFKTKMHVLVRKFFRWSGLHIFLIGALTSLIALIFCYNALNVFGILVLLSLLFLTFLQAIYFMGFRNKLTSAANHIIRVHFSSFRGVVSSFEGRKTSLWEQAESNRQ